MTAYILIFFGILFSSASLTQVQATDSGITQRALDFRGTIPTFRNIMLIKHPDN